MQAYVKEYEQRPSAIRRVNSSCLNTSDVAWMLSTDCLLNPRDICAAVAGLCCGLVWSLGFYLSSCLHCPTADNVQVWMRVSLVTHLFADILSCVGALMAMQFLEQVRQIFFKVKKKKRSLPCLLNWTYPANV